MADQFRAIPYNFKIILLGNSNVGKSCLIHQFVHGEYKELKPTCGVDYVTKTYNIDDEIVRLNIFDTAGQEKYLSLTQSYYKGTDAVLFVYSLNQRATFDSLEHWIKNYENSGQTKESLRVLVGTKKDIVEQQLIAKEELKQFHQKYKINFNFETSAKTNENITKMFEQISRSLLFNTMKKKKIENPIKNEELYLILKKELKHQSSESEQSKKKCC